VPVSDPSIGTYRARTAPEAAVAGWRICALASRDAAVAVLMVKIIPHLIRIMLTGVLPRTPVLLISRSAVDPPARERPAGLAPWSMADGMIRLRLQPATHGGR
jgi:hypothetical protein